jgi:hypothetical protein
MPLRFHTDGSLLLTRQFINKVVEVVSTLYAFEEELSHLSGHLANATMVRSRFIIINSLFLESLSATLLRIRDENIVEYNELAARFPEAEEIVEQAEESSEWHEPDDDYSSLGMP